MGIGGTDIAVRRDLMMVAGLKSTATIQVNLLRPIARRSSDAVVVMDLMRLPLGICIGARFMGGGTILRQDAAIFGGTTAATLRLVTVVGLCRGGGRLAEVPGSVGGAASCGRRSRRLELTAPAYPPSARRRHMHFAVPPC
jgi:hypothetical protein